MQRLEKRQSIRQELEKLESITATYYRHKDLLEKRRVYYQAVGQLELLKNLITKFPEDLEDDEYFYHQLEGKFKIMKAMQLEIKMMEAREIKLQVGNLKPETMPKPA